MSTPISLLCLILLIDFYKSANVRPNMLNYLKSTFTCGKQTKDNFINIKIQYRPAYLFIHSFSCPFCLWGESRETVALGRPEILHDQQ